MRKRRHRVTDVVLPFLLKDRFYMRSFDERQPADEIMYARPTGFIRAEAEGPLLDGPACRRVAVVDIDANTGKLRRGAKFVRRAKPTQWITLGLDARNIDQGARVATYRVSRRALAPDAPVEALESDAFVQVSAFATVLRAIQFFEAPDMLGRRISWAFRGPQLLVVPKAGEGRTAFYERESQSLQFFYFKAAEGHVVFSALSSDIVTHEAAHAILDGIAPDLYDATTPQSLALHESIADLTAIFLNLTDSTVVYSLFEISHFKLDVPSVLSRIASEYGSEIRREFGVDYLRTANNRRTLFARNRRRDRNGRPQLVDRCDPHALSEVMSGAIYGVFLQHVRELESVYNARWERGNVSMLSAREKRVAVAARQTARFVFRALDYLPPGEISFADFGRAMLAADRVSHPGGVRQRRWLVKELVRRGVVPNARSLLTVHPLVGRTAASPPKELLRSARQRRRFVTGLRRILGIPTSASIRILHPRKAGILHNDQPRRLFLRIGWAVVEQHRLLPPFRKSWRFAAGATIVIDFRTAVIVAVLISDRSATQRKDRGRMLQRWMNERLLTTRTGAHGPDGNAVQSRLVARSQGSAVQIAGGARLLHIAAIE